MLVEQDQNTATINSKEATMNQKVSNLGQDAANLSYFLDTKINEHQNSKELFLKEQHNKTNRNLIEQALLEQRRDIVALQEIEKSKQELERRIQQRYSTLRSISTIADRRKPPSQVPSTYQSKPNSSISQPRSSVKQDYHPYAQSVSIHKQQKSRKAKRHNCTKLIYPNNFDYSSDRFQSKVFSNSKSPTTLSKNSTIQHNFQDEQSQSQPTILQNKKIQRVQRKRIVINDNSSKQDMIQRDYTPISSKDRKHFELTKTRLFQSIPQHIRSKSNSRPTQARVIDNKRSLSANNRHLRSKSGQIQLKQRKKLPFLDKIRDKAYQLFSPTNQKQIKDNFQESIPMSIQENVTFNNFDNNDNFENQDEHNQNQNGIIEEMKTIQQDQPLFNQRQKLNFRYVIDDGQGTIDSDREDQTPDIEKKNTENHQQTEDDNSNFNTSSNYQPMFNRAQGESQCRQSIFTTPSNKNQEQVLQSTIINANKKLKIKSNFKNHAQQQSESGGFSKTTQSTIRPYQSSAMNNYVGALQLQQTQQAKLFSKARILSYQRGRFSSESSFLKFKQASNNMQKNSSNIDGEDSQCKFEDNEDFKIKEEIISQDQVTQIKEEEEFIEDEESKRSNKPMVKQSNSMQQTSRNVSHREQQRKQNNAFECSVYEDSNYNMLDSFGSPQKSIIHSNTRSGNQNSQDQQIQTGENLHSDDEIEIRRGLEPCSFRSQNPKEPELLRQSTQSLLGRARGAGNRSSMKDQNKQLNVTNPNNVDGEVALCNDSYEIYLKNADNFNS